MLSKRQGRLDRYGILATFQQMAGNSFIRLTIRIVLQLNNDVGISSM
jgi:hypothetical protein